MRDLFATPARMICGAVIALIIALAAWSWFTGTLTAGATGKVQARLNSGQLDAAIASASDTVNTLSTTAASEAASDAITLENDRAIHSAPGAAAPVDPALRRAGLVGLCRRAAYSGDSRCLQFTPAGNLDAGGSASAVAGR